MKLSRFDLLDAAESADWQRAARALARSFSDADAAAAALLPIRIVLCQTARAAEFQLRYNRKIFTWTDAGGFSVSPYSVKYEEPVFIAWHRLAVE